LQIDAVVFFPVFIIDEPVKVENQTVSKKVQAQGAQISAA
jgi:hypothetical protein